MNTTITSVDEFISMIEVGDKLWYLTYKKNKPSDVVGPVTLLRVERGTKDGISGLIASFRQIDGREDRILVSVFLEKARGVFMNGAKAHRCLKKRIRVFEANLRAVVDGEEMLELE